MSSITDLTSVLFISLILVTFLTLCIQGFARLVAGDAKEEPQPTNHSDTDKPQDYSTKHQSFEDLVRALDAAMYRAKEAENKLLIQARSWDDKEKHYKRSLEEAISSHKSSKVDDQRFGVLRRAIAKKFHPDSIQGSAIERAVRAEIFKELWAEVEIAEKSR